MHLPPPPPPTVCLSPPPCLHNIVRCLFSQHAQLTGLLIIPFLPFLCYRIVLLECRDGFADRLSSRYIFVFIFCLHYAPVCHMFRTPPAWHGRASFISPLYSLSPILVGKLRTCRNLSPFLSCCTLLPLSFCSTHVLDSTSSLFFITPFRRDVFCRHGG